jgi:hypothetical protein
MKKAEIVGIHDCDLDQVIDVLDREEFADVPHRGFAIREDGADGLRHVRVREKRDAGVAEIYFGAPPAVEKPTCSFSTSPRKVKKVRVSSISSCVKGRVM